MLRVVSVTLHQNKTNMNMKLSLFVISMGGVLITTLASSVFTVQPVSANGALVCSAQSGLFVASNTSPVASDVGAQARSAAAFQWLERMMDPSQAMSDGSSITPSMQYASEYQGSVSGTFTLANPTPIVSDTPLTVTSPRPLADSYRGIVTGTSSYVGARYQVKAYLLVDIEYEQPSVIPATVGDDGSWTLDLSPIPPERAGSWVFRLYDTNTMQLVGQGWPQLETYQDIVVQAYSVTDTAYLQDSQPARADNTWSFPSVGQGIKMFRLFNTSSNEILTEYYQTERTGLIRSYEYRPGQDGYGTARAFNSYLYDQALALLVAVGAENKPLADELVAGFAAVQVTTGPFAGAFPSYANQRNPANAGTDYYTGANAIMAYALARYVEAYGNQGGAQTMLENVLGFIETQKTLSGPAAGIYRGGGSMTIEGTPTYRPWHSTEHNIDLWHTYELVGRLIDPAYTEKARDLSTAIIDTLWNEPEQRFNQGFQDTNYALDTASWGAIFLAAVGEYEKAAQSLQAAEAYAITYDGISGYKPYLASSSTPSVWFEGTFGVALAQRFVDTTTNSLAAQTLRNTYGAQDANGAWQYVQVADTANEFADAFSVASTAWYLLATDYADVMWSECIIPAVSSEEVPGRDTPKTPVTQIDATIPVAQERTGSDSTRTESRLEPLPQREESQIDGPQRQQPSENETDSSEKIVQTIVIAVVGVVGLGFIGYLGYSVLTRFIR